MMKYKCSTILLITVLSAQPILVFAQKTKNIDAATIKQHLLLLERKWIEAEFALDTAYISTLMDSTFQSVNADQILNKQQELDGIFKNIRSMRRDSIFLDSVKLEDASVEVYDNTAVAIFIAHTYKKEKRRPTEKRTRFYDVWINRNGKWLAVASQGTTIEN